MADVQFLPEPGGAPTTWSLSEVRHADVVVTLNPPLQLQVATDASGQLWCAFHGELGLHAEASCPEQLLADIAAQVAFLWAEYAEADPITLPPASRRLRAILRGNTSQPASVP